jgi:hypothetical protein
LAARVLKAAAVIVLLCGLSGDKARAWTDDPLIPGDTPIKRRHFKELRAAIDNTRLLCGLEGYNWSDPTLIGGSHTIRKVHIDELRQAVKDIYVLSGAPAPVFTDDIIDYGTTPVRAVHIQELRAAIDGAVCCGDGVCSPGETSTSCSPDCYCNYGNWVNMSCQTGGCLSEQMQQQKTSFQTGCPPLYRCVQDLASCCAHGDEIYLGCGAGTCPPSQKLVQRPALNANCDDIFYCKDVGTDCCVYNAAQPANQCGTDGCAANEIYMVDTTPASAGCPAQANYCQQNDLLCCGGYSNWNEAAGSSQCGLGGCDPEYKYVERSALNTASGCPVDTTCLLNQIDCCGGYSDWNEAAGSSQCGQGGCGPQYKYIQQFPLDTGSTCPVISTCSTRTIECCGYTAYAPVTSPASAACGINGCSPGRVSESQSPTVAGSACPVKSRCTIDPVNCGSVFVCTDGSNEACVIGGCDGTRTCANNAWSSCVENPDVCAPGALQDCGGGRNQICNTCGSGWSVCGCPVIQAEEPCATVDGCAGLSTCTAGIWSACQSTNLICNPGQTVSCPLTAFISGYKSCNTCGDGWTACVCNEGAVIPCDNGTGTMTCQGGAFGSCVSN